MFYQLFKRSHPGHIIILPILAFLLFLPGIQSDKAIGEFAFDHYQAPLYRWIDFFFEQRPLAGAIFSNILVVVVAFLINLIKNKYILIKESTYLPAFFYIIITLAFEPMNRLNPALLAMPLIIFAVDLVLASYKKALLAYHYFDAAFLVALASFIYLPAIGLVLFLFFAQSILRPFVWREWLFIILGMLTPFVIYFSFAYVFQDNLLYAFDRLAILFSSTNHFFDHLNYGTGIFYGFFVLLTVLAVGHTFGHFQMQKIAVRNYFTTFIWLFLILVLITLLSPITGWGMVYLLAFPAAIFLANYFTYLKKRWLGEVIFLILFLLLLFIRYQDQIHF